MQEALDTKLSQLKELEAQIETLSGEKESLRKEVFEIIEAENIGQYKNEVATVSYTERKSVKFTRDVNEILEEIKDLPKYFDLVPEHKELNGQFNMDVKEGIFKIEGVEIETKKLPMIRFAK
jgi:hypothetical protein